MQDLEPLFFVLAGLAAFLFVSGLGMPPGQARKALGAMKQFRPRSLGKGKLLDGIADSGARRALRKDKQNEKYLRQLKQANWYWEVGEPQMPSSKAPFWNLETLWGEKMVGAAVYGALVATVLLVVGIMASLIFKLPVMRFVGGSVLLGGMFAMMNYASPDSALAEAAITRQKELTLEMGFRVPELRADVIAGNTIQRAIRNMSKRPGGPFVEELRRAVQILDVTRDETLAMDQLLDRNVGNELLTEFGNSVKMVSRQGGQIGPVLNVLSDLAQQRLRLSIISQARKNLQEMTRPIAMSNLLVMSMLIILPALATILDAISR